MTREQPTRRTGPPLLLLVNTGPDSEARVRSGARRVLHWRGEGRFGEHCFGGDLSDPRTYAVAADAEAVTAVIELPDDGQALAALRALREVRPEAAVLLLSATLSDAPGDGTLARGGSLRDVLRLDLEEELRRLETERRLYCLREFVAAGDVVPILVHPDPDPDALGSALALRLLLDRSPAQSPVLAMGPIRNLENRRLAQLLDLEVRTVEQRELAALDHLLVVDVQPAGLFARRGPRLAVIDHHPPEEGYHAEFLDLRPEYGAAASMLTEYLRASGESQVGSLAATALLHGIKTDTDLLTRGVSPEDVQAYAFLQERADRELLRRLERPSFSAAAARCYGAALAGVVVEAGIVVAHAGEVPGDAAHLLPELADFCLGLEDARIAVASGFIDAELVLTLRYGGRDGLDVGELARRLAEGGGQGGGHASMARASLPRQVAAERFGLRAGEGLPARLIACLRELTAAVDGSEALTRRS